MALQHLINHISLVVDRSGSMAPHADKVVQVFDRELNALKQRSVDAHQETRISIYLFDTTIEVLTFDMDVMRFTSLKGYYKLGDMTALIDATVKSIEDHRKLPELYGDHAFLTYVITDGQENKSTKHNAFSLQSLINASKDNWTTAILVPDAAAANAAERYGFSRGSISQWNTSSSTAIEEIGNQFTTVTSSYMAMRSAGTRGTKNLFTLDPGKVQSKSQLAELPSNQYDVYPVRAVSAIKDYVESFTGEKYRLGSTYYQPTKPVVLQDFKKILMQDTKTGRVYEGNNIRQLLGLPDYTVEVNPLHHPDWRMFIQSASVNRKLFPNTFILVRR